MWEAWIGAVIILSHFIVIGLLVLWFGLRKPLTVAEFWSRFKSEIL